MDRILNEAEALLQKREPEVAGVAYQPGLAQGYRPRTLTGAVKAHPEINLAAISVAGRYAADEAWEALHRGLHVFLFSDNVSLEDEVMLKQYAREVGLLVMGPGAGTAIINGVALGFANAVPAGPVGLVSAAGTGLQEVTSLLARQGIGISQAIGSGGRDLSEAVGGITTLMGLQALQEDPATEVIVLISKPPAASIVKEVIQQITFSDKPTVVCFLGEDAHTMGLADRPGIWVARTLEEAALQSAALVRSGEGPSLAASFQPEARVAELRQRLKPGQRYLRGLFSGGTLCYEAQVIWRESLSEAVYSNAPLNKAYRLPDSARSLKHTAVDLGEEEFTVGRPHPMIDNDLRIRRLLQEARDAEVAVIMLDVVLGYGAHPDPASELAPAILQARHLASDAGRELLFIASVTGTPGDPQDYNRQRQQLEEAGVVLCPSNAAAARLVSQVLMEAYG
jgi:succinyl-CoA synthetase alpha subunit